MFSLSNSASSSSYHLIASFDTTYGGSVKGMEASSSSVDGSSIGMFDGRMGFCIHHSPPQSRRFYSTPVMQLDTCFALWPFSRLWVTEPRETS